MIQLCKYIVFSWIWIVMGQAVMLAQSPRVIAVVNKDDVWAAIKHAEELAFHYPEIALKELDIVYSPHLKPEIRFAILRSKGLILERQNDLNAAFKNYSEALSIAPTVADKLTVMQDMAITERKRVNYAASAKLFHQTLDLATQFQDWEMIQAAYDGLGSLYDAISDFEEALKFQLKSLEVAKKHQDEYGQLLSYQNIAATQTKSKHYDLALNYLQLAYDLAVRLKDTLQLANVYHDKGVVLSAMGKQLNALSETEQGFLLYQKIGFLTKIATAHLTMANILHSMGRLEDAIFHLNSAQQLEDHLSNYDKTGLYLTFGDVVARQSRLGQAEASYLHAVKLAGYFGQLDQKMKAMKALSDIYHRLGRAETAYSTLSSALVLHDSLFNLSRTQLRAEQQLKFDIQQRDHEIKELKHKNERTTLLGIFSVLGISFISLLALFISQRKHLLTLKEQRQQLRFQNEKLEESNEILRQFAYAAAHDLKEPLRTIGSFTSLLKLKLSHQLGEQSKDYFDFITQGVARMNSLLTDLLHFSTVISQSPQPEPIEAQSVLQEVLQDLKAKIEATNAIINVTQPLPSLMVSRVHMAQLFQNLLSNAIKFCDTQPHILIKGFTTGQQAVIKISDNGIGMKPEYVSKIFNLFHQLNKHDNRYEGTGIGLTICKNIVEKYNGQIHVESLEGKGTTFTIILPATN